MASVAAGTSSYRLWIYTSAQDTGGAKGHLTLKLAGTLGEVTFAHLERSPARQGTLFAPGHSTVLSPLTTLKVQLMTDGMDAAAAEVRIRTAFRCASPLIHRAMAPAGEGQLTPPRPAASPRRST